MPVVDHELSIEILNYPHDVYFLLIRVKTRFTTLHVGNVFLL